MIDPETQAFLTKLYHAVDNYLKKRSFFFQRVVFKAAIGKNKQGTKKSNNRFS